jgi:hypothetical protein
MPQMFSAKHEPRLVIIDIDPKDATESYDYDDDEERLTRKDVSFFFLSTFILARNARLPLL